MMQDSQGNQEKPEVKVPGIHFLRERSRAAAKVIDEYPMPFVEKENYQLPNKYRLQPEGNLYKDQEDHKVHVDIHEWRCGYCRKTFYEEKYEKHFNNHHFDLVNAESRSHGNCLADLCGSLHCDLVMDYSAKKGKCNPAATAKIRHSCETDVSLFREVLQQTVFMKRRSISYIVVCVLVLMLLPLFYVFVYLYQRRGTQDLRRISFNTRNKKPS